MSLLFNWSGRISQALAGLTMLLLGILVLLVSADVLVRTAGLRPLAWAPATAEYILLYACFLPMPALVRGKGHVFVEFMRGPMPPALKRAAEMAVYAVCALICGFLTVVAVGHLVNALRTGGYETRSYDMPTWAIYLPMVLGFGLAALEWLRFLTGVDSLYAIDPLQMDGY